MTEKLRDVLQEEAGAARVPPTDLGPVLRAGGRAVRRRRAVGTVAVAAVTALAVAIAPAIVDRLGDGSSASQGPASGGSDLSIPWADADTLHFGDVAVPRPDGLNALSYAPSTGYLAYSVDDGDWYEGDVFVMSSDGEVTQVNEGPVISDYLVSDGGDEFAWVEQTPDGRWVAAIRHASGDISTIDLSGSNGAPFLVALDDGVVYYDNWGKVWSASEGSSPEPMGMTSEALLDHRDGIVAFVSDEQANRGSNGTVYFEDQSGHELGRAENLFMAGKLDVGDGPDDAVFLGEGPVMVDVSSGEKTPFKVGRKWHMDQVTLVEDRVLMTAFSGASGEWVMRLLTCSSTTGACEVVDEQQTAHGEDYRLPDSPGFARQLEFTPEPPLG